MGLSRQEVKSKYDKVAGANGVVAFKDLYLLAGEFGLPSNAQYLVQVQGSLRELYQGGDIVEDGIPFELWFNWYKLEVTPGSFDQYNELLVRRVIGKVKYPTRNLKDHGFVYGQKNKADKEGAGEVVLNWVAGKRSESKETGVSLMKVNKEAVKNKLITPKAVNQFLRENKDAKHLQRPKIVGRKKARGPVHAVEERHERSSREVKEDINKIIYPYEDNADESEHYVDLSGQMKKGRLPKPRQTKCSELLRDHARELEGKAQDKEQWKMSKFTKKAKAKIDMRRTAQA